MTFEEFWQDNKNFMYGVDDPYLIAERVWNAAKEDSKPVAKIVERKLYGMNTVEYSIIGFDGFESAIRSTRDKAEQWAIENGYRIADS